MTGEPTPADALVRIPGWKHASWRALDGGLTNHAWLVEAGGRRAVLKIDDTVRGTPFTGRRLEARVQRSAAAAGLAPRVLFATETIYLTEYVEGRPWDRESLLDERNLLAVAQAIRSVHALPLTGRRFDAVAAATAYLGGIGDDDKAAAECHVESLRSASPPDTLCCCHNDLVAENVIDTTASSAARRALVFVDWEYACDNDPMFDLATLIAHHGLSEAQSGILLDACFDGDRKDTRERLRGQIRTYEALCWLWLRARP